MPSVQHFLGLWCSSVSDGLSAVTGCPISSYPEDNGVAVLAPSFPPPGTQNCGFCDTREVAAIAKCLLSCVASAAVDKAVGDPFASLTNNADDIRKELLIYLNKVSDDYSRRILRPLDDDDEEEEENIIRPSEVVDTFIANFMILMARKRSWLSQISTKLSPEDKVDDRIGEVLKELEKSGFWSYERRENLAKVLIDRVDPDGYSHCQDSFPLRDEDALLDHQMQCPFAPYACANQGCGKVNSVLHAAEHDEVCLRKSVPCRLKCPVDVPREDMDTHCLTVCAMKSVSCRYSAIGCTEQVVQGSLQKHCEECVEKHLYFTVLSYQETAARSLDHEKRLAACEEAVAMAQHVIGVDIRGITVSMRQVEGQIKGLEGDLKKTNREIKAVDNSAEVAQIRNEIMMMKNIVSPAPASAVQAPKAVDE